MDTPGRAKLFPKRGRKRARAAMEWARSIALALAAVLIVRGFVFTVVRVDGRSMADTLLDGDLAAVTLWDMRTGAPRRGDVVICAFPGERTLSVKRVVGLPGETVEIAGGVTYIDGRPLEEDYLTHPTAQAFGPFTVEAGRYFVMGDNRALSRDSREVGAIDGGAIYGRVRYVLWPPGRFGPVA